MTPEQQAAFIMSQSACALAEMFAMWAENMAAMLNDRMPPHGPDAFLALPDRHGIGHNAVVSFFR